jgi:hypothetical protein
MGAPGGRKCQIQLAETHNPSPVHITRINMNPTAAPCRLLNEPPNINLTTYLLLR